MKSGTLLFNPDCGYAFVSEMVDEIYFVIKSFRGHVFIYNNQTLVQSIWKKVEK